MVDERVDRRRPFVVLRRRRDHDFQIGNADDELTAKAARHDRVDCAIADRYGMSPPEISVANAGQSHDGGVTEVGIAIGVVAQQSEEGGDGFGTSQATEGVGGESAHARAGITEKADETVVGGGGAEIAEDACGLRPDLGFGVPEEPGEEIHHVRFGEDLSLARDLAELRQITKVPIMADESAFNLTEAWTVAAARAADIISIYPGKNGGIAAALEIAHLAKAAGLVCHMGSNLELGIATAAMIHLAAACPTIACETYPVDILGPLYHEWDVIKTPLQLGPEVAVVPEGPGLGVELDEGRLK